MALTKAYSELDAVQELAQNAVKEGAILTISDAYVAELAISMALTSVTAHTGTKIIVQVSYNASGDEDWVDHVSFVGPTGTANTEASTANPLTAASTTGTVASTTGYDADGTLWIFIEDTTFASGEFLYLVSHSANTSITWLDGTANEHAQTTSIFWNIARRYVVLLPAGAARARVVYDNTYDSDGSTVAIYTRAGEWTAV